MTGMQWTTALTRERDTGRALDALAQSVRADLGAAPDLLCCFASPHYRDDYPGLPGALRERLGPAALIGCSASGVIGAGHEVEREAAIALSAARMPGVTVEVWHVEARDLAPGSDHNARLARLVDGAGMPQLLILADPFSFPAERLLRSLEHAGGAGVIAGGLASGGQAAGEIVLFEGGVTHRSGALLAAFSGDVEMVTAVAQGCRPVGEPMFVSGCDGGRLTALDGQPPLELLNALYAQSSEADRRLMQHSLFIGLAMQPGESRYAQGDFLIRNLVGADQDSGALLVGAELRERQVVQFHLRDARTSAEDLERVLARLAGELGGAQAAGGLLFSCTGRGAGLYGEPDHDSSVFRAQLGAVPLGGFFCNGEIGQVAGLPFLHGYTSAFAVFRPRKT